MYCFSLFCRLCFRRDCKLFNLFTKDDDMITFNDKLKSCIPEIICDEDRIPNFICDICCTKLRKGYEFKSMCVKNHVALRDYAKQLLKYMENPINNQNLLNMKMNKLETESNENEIKDKDKTIESENDSDYSDDDSEKLKIKEESSDELNTSIDIKDEPLALVKSDRNKESQNGENSFNTFTAHAKPDTDLSVKRVKIETESDEDSDYKCEDLTKKPNTIPEKVFPERVENDKVLPPRDYLPKDALLTGYNMTNDMVMKYLKLEYSEREENRINGIGQSAEHPENLCTADSETEQEESCTWNSSAREEPKKMKTRTKDKYRIVYTENQRLELEKEFIVSRYITTSRKIQLSTTLNLSQRQIKIWFQNRRAKERKQVKRSAEQFGSDGNTDPSIASCETPTNSAEHNVSMLPNKEVMPQMVEVQKELFVLQRQQDSYMQQQSDAKNNLDELYKQKQDLLNHRLQVLLHQQKDLSSNNQLETSSH